MPRHIVMIGFGAIGRHVARLLAPELRAGDVALTALVRDPDAHVDHDELGARIRGIDSPAHPDWDGLITAADLVVECAGVSAASLFGPAVIAADTPLVLTSVGALADPEIRAGLLARPGLLRVTNGAIGGLDVLEAAAQAGMLAEVRLRTAKSAAGLVQPWMSAEEVARLHALTPAEGALTIFSGNPAEAIAKFPANVNIAVALAWATRGLTDGTTSDVELMERSLRRVRVELVAEPEPDHTGHVISAFGPAGRFEFTIHSAPSPENPATSGQTALSVARTTRLVLAELDRRAGVSDRDDPDHGAFADTTPDAPTERALP